MQLGSLPIVLAVCVSTIAFQRVKAFSFVSIKHQTATGAIRRYPSSPGLFSGLQQSQEKEGAPQLSDHAPSWQELQQRVLNTPTGRRLQQEAIDRKAGRGPPHTGANLRLFSAPDESQVRVTLYRDQAAWCPYCQKVWLYLEEKQIPYRVQKVPLNAYGDKPSWYTRLVDGGKLPTAEIDGVLIRESSDIIHTLEDTFRDHGLPIMIPTDAEANKRRDDLLCLEQELQSRWFSLTFYPVKGQALDNARQNFLDTLSQLDDALGVTDGPWLLGGDTPSLIDIQFITQVERILPSVLYWKGLCLRHTQFANMDQWLDAFEERPAYLASKSDFYTHIMVLPSQNGPGYMVPEAKEVASQICGLTGGTWHLPLDLEESNRLEPIPPKTVGREEDHNPCHEAADKLIRNHANIVEFACRGAGEPGNPSFHAELADPYAEPNGNFVSAVDIVLRHVAHALLMHQHAGLGRSDNDSPTTSSRTAKRDLQGTGGSGALRENWEAFPDEDNPSLTYYYNWETGDSTWTPPTRQLDTCLMYLRDRIGVPRDMGFAAAMHFRAHLNWAIDMMKEEQ